MTGVIRIIVKVFLLIRQIIKIDRGAMPAIYRNAMFSVKLSVKRTRKFYIVITKVILFIIEVIFLVVKFIFRLKIIQIFVVFVNIVFVIHTLIIPLYGRFSKTIHPFRLQKNNPICYNCKTDNAEKHFDNWNKVKSDLHFAGIFRDIKEGDIWWCSMGENVGIEINGKQEFFLRPVLVLKKLSKFGFMGVPLTSQPHEGSWYVPFIFKDKKQNAVLAQARVLSVFRLRRKMGVVPNSDLELVQTGFKKLYCQ